MSKFFQSTRRGHRKTRYRPHEKEKVLSCVSSQDEIETPRPIAQNQKYTGQRERDNSDQTEYNSYQEEVKWRQDNKKSKNTGRHVYKIITHDTAASSQAHGFELNNFV